MKFDPTNSEALREWFKNDQRVIRPRHQRFCNRNQVVLLSKYAQAGWSRFTAIQLRGRARRRLHAAGLDLSDSHIEFGAVAHAPFNDRQNVHAWKVRQQILQPNQVICKLARSRTFRQLFEFDGLLERKFSHRRTRDLREMRAATQLLSHFMRERADISAGGAFDGKPRQAVLHLNEVVVKQLNFHRFESDFLMSARQIVSRTSMTHLCGEHWMRLV